MEFTDEQMRIFRLLRKIEETAPGRRAGTVFGPGRGLEQVTSIIRNHFHRDVGEIRACGHGMRQLLNAFAEAGHIRFGDVMDVMARDEWSTDESRMMESMRADEVDPDTAAVGLGMVAIEYWTGEGIGLVRKWYEERDDLALEITAWLAVAVVRLGEVGKVPKAPTSRHVATPEPAPAAEASGCGRALGIAALAAAAAASLRLRLR